MSRVYLPSDKPEAWQTVLAEPEKHWRQGYSARALAYCWHHAAVWPPEIAALWKSSAYTPLHVAEPLLKLVEHQTKLPGKGFPSQNDLLVLARAGDGNLITATVEGKVSESFGESLATWKAGGKGFSTNKQARLEGLHDQIGLRVVPDSIHYQLIHRMASAVLEARRFNASYAVMIIHSFSPQHAHWEAFAHFLGLYGVTGQFDTLFELVEVEGMRLFAGWATGDPDYLQS